MKIYEFFYRFNLLIVFIQHLNLYYFFIFGLSKIYFLSSVALTFFYLIFINLYHYF